MTIDRLIVGPFGVNCYIATGDPGQALVVDPGGDAADIVAFLNSRRLSVAAYLLTHGHIDHVSALADVCAAFPAPVAMHHRDASWAFTDANQLQPYYPPPRRPTVPIRELSGQQPCGGAGLEGVAIPTPGHSPGSVCFWFEKQQVLFSGDTLFQSSVGRTDLPGGDPAALRQSLLKLAQLPDTTQVYPGHGDPTTIAIEKTSNPFLQGPRGRPL